jgi:dephospho-CoA kinase
VTRPTAVAITGGIGAGKSEALAAFARHGAATVSSDEIVHELLRNDEVREKIVERFGNGVVAPNGQLDRGAVGTIVFNDHGELTWLENLLHPLVTFEYMTWRERLAELPDPPQVCVTEIPLLYEVGAEERFDKVVVITAPAEERRARAQATMHERDRRFLPDEEKVARADYAYTNTGTLTELDKFVGSVMDDLTR